MGCSNGVAIEEERPAVLAGTTATTGFVQSLEAYAALPLQQVTCRVPERSLIFLIYYKFLDYSAVSNYKSSSITALYLIDLKFINFNSI